jgi:hypothetical protein
MTVLEDVYFYRIMIAVMSGLGFILAFGTCGPAQLDTKQYPLMTLMLKVWFVYSVYLTIITLARGGELGRTIYAGTVFYYMIMSMTLTFRHIQAGYDNKYFWQVLVIMAVLSTSVNFYFARFSSQTFDVSEFAFIEDMRSQIISGSNMIIVAVGLIGITKSKNVALSYTLFSMIMFIYIISKTRNILLGVLLLLIYAILVSEKRLLASTRLFVGLAIALLIAYIVPLYTINYDIYEAWFGRVFDDDEGFSLETFYTRLAEYRGQLNMLTEDFQSGLFGFGYLQTMIWDARTWDTFFSTLDPIYYYGTRYVGQHSTWINSIFHGGFIMGLVPTISAFAVAWIGLKQVFLPKEERSQLDLYGLFGTGVVIYMLIPSTFGMLYIDRLSTVSFAPALIFAVYGWEKFRNSRKLMQTENADPSTFPLPAHGLTGQPVEQQVRQF